MCRSRVVKYRWDGQEFSWLPKVYDQIAIPVVWMQGRMV
jgi:hypothetical protein